MKQFNSVLECEWSGCTDELRFQVSLLCHPKIVENLFFLQEFAKNLPLTLLYEHFVREKGYVITILERV